MITVADILAIPAFEKVDIIAPIQGAGERRVYNVGILDCPPAINQYSVYMPGEFILTNLGFCYGDPELSDRSLITMMERGVRSDRGQASVWSMFYRCRKRGERAPGCSRLPLFRCIS